MSKPKTRPFPAIQGGCYCGSTRYRLETAPLFCYACHCADCNKQTGSVYACFTTIELEFISSIGAIPPKITNTRTPTGIITQAASCAKCGTRLWGGSNQRPTVNIATGTLDHLQLMEPDVHQFIEGKIPWVILPEGAKTCKGPLDYRECWPKSSLKRLELAVQRARARKEAMRVAGKGQDAEEEKEADKTPTAQTPDEKEEVVEDDEEFERRYRQTENALQERLEALSLRLKDTEEVQGDDLRSDVADKKIPPGGRDSQVSTGPVSEG